MIDMQAVEKSRKLYEEARDYFVSQKITECVIEILLDKPMSEWIIHFTKTESAMFRMRSALSNAKKPFIAIYNVNEGTHFFFKNCILRNLELVETQLNIFSDILDEGVHNKNQIVKEFLELKKSLQKS